MEKRVIINADDYGLTGAVSKGIRQAYLQGILTSTTVMATGLTVDADLPLLFTECPGIGIGAHLTLSTLKPVLNPGQIPSLVNAGGSFYRLNDLMNHAPLLDEDELYAEWKAQIDSLLARGVAVDHIDSHHSACLISVKTVQVMLRLALAYGLPVRTPQSSNLQTEMDEYASAELDKHGIKYPEHFNGDFLADGSLQSLSSILSGLNPGTTEIMTHPGLVDDDLLSLSSMTAARVTELNALCSAEAKSLLIENKIQPATFGSIFKR